MDIDQRLLTSQNLRNGITHGHTAINLLPNSYIANEVPLSIVMPTKEAKLECERQLVYCSGTQHVTQHTQLARPDVSQVTARSMVLFHKMVSHCLEACMHALHGCIKTCCDHELMIAQLKMLLHHTVRKVCGKSGGKPAHTRSILPPKKNRINAMLNSTVRPCALQKTRTKEMMLEA